MVDNIFSSLMYKKTTGAVLEFVLWCGVCFAALMAMAAFALGKGNVTWILLMLFSIGLGVLMAFCQRGIAIIYSICAFCVINLLVHFSVFVNGYYGGKYSSPWNILLLTLALLLGIAAAACASIQFFSKLQLGRVTAVLALCESALIMFLQVLIYAVGFLGDYSGENMFHRRWLDERGYWIGTLGYWILLAVACVYLCAIFWGPLEKAKSKLPGQAVPVRAVQAGGGVRGGQAAFHPGLQGLQGIYAGRAFYLQGRELMMGSGEGVDIVIRDVYVSRIHCAVRFQASMGYYEILDQSKNGVFFANGTPLPKGVYSPVQRGSVICIGSGGQQFKLL